MTWDILAASWPILLSLVGLLGASAFFSSSETAIFSLGASQLRRLREEKRRGANRLEALLQDRSRLLVVILLGNLAINVLYFNLGALVSVRLARGGAGLAAGITPVLVLLGIVIFGEIIPKTLAVHHAPRFALVAAAPLHLLDIVLWLPRVVLGAVAEGISRSIMGRRREEGELTDEELDELLRLSAETGNIAKHEGDWLQAVLELSAVPVEEVMTPRVEIVAFRLGGGRGQFLQLVEEHRRNKIPVYRESLDDIHGYLNIRDVLLDPGATIESLVRPVAFIPDSAPLERVSEGLEADLERVFIVVDEYGGTEGLVTREDLVEAIVGDLSDEGDPEAPPVRTLGNGHFDVSASLGLRFWGRLTGRRLDALPVATVGGLLGLSLGRIVAPGDEIRSGNVRLRVLSMNGRRPGRIEVWRDSREESAA